jgi:hypothetical protein
LRICTGAKQLRRRAGQRAGVAEELGLLRGARVAVIDQRIAEVMVNGGAQAVVAREVDVQRGHVARQRGQLLITQGAVVAAKPFHESAIGVGRGRDQLQPFARAETKGRAEGGLARGTGHHHLPRAEEALVFQKVGQHE